VPIGESRAFRKFCDRILRHCPRGGHWSEFAAQKSGIVAAAAHKGGDISFDTAFV
jgi:hypothetical protein